MFAPRYFAPRYFAPRYFANAGAEAFTPGPTTGRSRAGFIAGVGLMRTILLLLLPALL